MKEIFSLLEQLVHFCTVFVSRILTLRHKQRNFSIHKEGTDEIRKEDKDE